LHGNIAEVTSGELVSVQGNAATVVLDGHTIGVDVALSSITPEEGSLGNMSGRPNEHAVIDLTPRNLRS
jgi:hypothetical protein